MGLDSIELVLEIEEYFGIRIPDAEAEKITTVQNMVDAVAGHLKVYNNSTELRDSILRRVNKAFIKLGLSENAIGLSDLINKLYSAAGHRGLESR